MTITQISFEQGESVLDWHALTRAFDAGHRLPKAEITDTFLYRGRDTLLNRAAWIDGLGLAVKSATVFPANPANGIPMINGGVNLYDDATGMLDALVDFHLVTKWKTAGDSLCAALKLARRDSAKILIVGAGTVGRSLRAAYGAGFPDAEFRVWNRTAAAGEKFAHDFENTTFVPNLRNAVEWADIITSATMSTDPLIKGAWLRPGQHLDLIGAYRPDMRETDDDALTRSRIFVDSLDTTVDHIGELKIPLAQGVIHKTDIVADYYNPEQFKRTTDNEITLFKNGGGAHLDLMTSKHILESWRAQQ
jgi:ornithine cyclodeaminase/alanine dehydrogenase-like protein (mu-crystallin family)